MLVAIQLLESLFEGPAAGTQGVSVGAILVLVLWRGGGHIILNPNFHRCSSSVIDKDHHSSSCASLHIIREIVSVHLSPAAWNNPSWPSIEKLPEQQYTLPMQAGTHKSSHTIGPGGGEEVLR